MIIGICLGGLMICFDLEFFLCEGASGFSGRWLMMGCDDVSGYWDWRLLRLPLSEREREREMIPCTCSLRYGSRVFCNGRNSPRSLMYEVYLNHSENLGDMMLIPSQNSQRYLQILCV